MLRKYFILVLICVFMLPGISAVHAGIDHNGTAVTDGGKPKSSKSDRAIFGKSNRKKKSYQKSVKHHSKRLKKQKGPK